MFNEKEKGLLKDLKDSEQLCVEKYAKYENDACDPKLKSLMNQIGSQEKMHLQTICKMMNGEMPETSGQGGGQQKSAPEKGDYANNSTAFENDKYLCSDALSTEKHVSSLYDTCIFEFKSVPVRNTLNHLQKEEQEHGEKIYSYMEQNNMYS